MKITKRTQNRNSEVTQTEIFMKIECHFGAENEPKSNPNCRTVVTDGQYGGAAGQGR